MTLHIQKLAASSHIDIIKSNTKLIKTTQTKKVGEKSKSNLGDNKSQIKAIK